MKWAIALTFFCSAAIARADRMSPWLARLAKSEDAKRVATWRVDLDGDGALDTLTELCLIGEQKADRASTSSRRRAGDDTPRSSTTTTIR